MSKSKPLSDVRLDGMDSIVNREMHINVDTCHSVNVMVVKGRYKKRLEDV